MCFVLGDMFRKSDVAIFKAALLSSQTEHTFVVSLCETFKVSANEKNNALTGNSALIAIDKAQYSASAILNAIKDCNFDAHKTGVPPNVKMYPVRLFTQVESFGSSAPQSPAKLLSAYMSKVKSGFGRITIPRVRVPFKYLAIRFNAFSCDHFGQCVNLAHKCTTYAMSGLEFEDKYIIIPTTDE